MTRSASNPLPRRASAWSSWPSFKTGVALENRSFPGKFAALLAVFTSFHMLSTRLLDAFWGDSSLQRPSPTSAACSCQLSSCTLVRCKEMKICKVTSHIFIRLIIYQALSTINHSNCQLLNNLKIAGCRMSYLSILLLQVFTLSPLEDVQPVEVIRGPSAIKPSLRSRRWSHRGKGAKP